MSDNTNPTGIGGSFLEEMVYVKDVRSKRVSSWDRTGANMDAITIPPHETAVLADISGAGCIRHFYCTTNHNDRFYMRKCILRMYWDNEETPSVEVPLGDFFGLGFCEPAYFGSLLVTVAPGGDGCGPKAALIGLNNYFPMPFSERALITLENDSDGTFGACWYHIDYEEHDSIPKNMARFHAQWRRENPTVPIDPPDEHNLTGDDNYVILEAEGQGNYVGMFINVDNITGGWYGEGDDMIFIDDDTWPPSFHGTGSEEIFGGGACPNSEYSTPYTGYHLISNKDFSGKQSMYRFHVNDPVRFKKRIKVTIEHGTGNDLGNDYSSTAFWYQVEPHATFPELLPADQRIPRCDEEYLPIYKKELEGYAIMGALLKKAGGVKELLDMMKDYWPECNKLGQELSSLVEAKDYEAAARKADELVAKYKEAADKVG